MCIYKLSDLYSVQQDITKFLVGFSGQDGLNGIAFSIDNASLRAHSIIEVKHHQETSILIFLCGF